MRTVWIGHLSLAAALVLGGACLKDASAGNFSATTVKYWDVRLDNGQYLSSTSSEVVILVDDITYSQDYTPCNTEEACAFFGPSDVPNEFEYGGGQIPSMPVGPFGFGMIGSVTGYTELITSRVARLTMELQDGDGTGNIRVVDRFGLMTYGQQVFRKYVTSFMYWAWAVSECGGGVGYGMGDQDHVVNLTQTLTSVQTSQSRHYQTPYIVRLGRVYLGANLGTSGGIYALIKGRTIATTDPNAPVIDTTITVN